MEYGGGSITGARVLVIDDDPDTTTLVTSVLKPNGYVVYRACDGREGLKNAYELHPDLVILDIMMPDIDGWDVCTRLRELSDVPILMLTARSAEADMLRGFGLGADDYMKKPFSSAELEARVQALLRRQKNHFGTSGINHYADEILSIDLETGTVELEGRALDLSTTEYSLFACLVRNLGRTVTHRQLLREVWGCEYEDISTNLTFYIDNHMTIWRDVQESLASDGILWQKTRPRGRPERKIACVVATEIMSIVTCFMYQYMLR